MGLGSCTKSIAQLVQRICARVILHGSSAFTEYFEDSDSLLSVPNKVTPSPVPQFVLSFIMNPPPPPPYYEPSVFPGDPFESKCDLVIAIDFGTTFSGVAYAHEGDAALTASSMSEMKRVAKKVTVVRTWPDQEGTPNDKIPTLLSYNSSPPHWGASVAPRDKPRAAYFKLGLQGNLTSVYPNRAYSTSPSSLMGGYLMDHNWRHPDLPHKKAVDFTADYLTHIVQYVLKEVLPLHFDEEFLRNQQLSYVITVPAIWSDRAKELTCQAAVRAGIARRKVMLITEPEAAALYCATLCSDMNLRQGDMFLVCDAGGGTVVHSTWLFKLIPGSNMLQTSQFTTFQHRRMQPWFWRYLWCSFSRPRF